MPTVNIEVATEPLQAFADAWNRHDADAMVSFMTQDCVFEASVVGE
jgi:ketosteroid isomerase-like protein